MIDVYPRRRVSRLVLHDQPVMGIIGSIAYWCDGIDLKLKCIAPKSSARMTIRMRGVA